MMKKCFVSLIALMASLALFGQHAEVGSERIPGDFDSRAHHEQQAFMFNWLMEAHNDIPAKNRIFVEPTDDDLIRVANYNCKSCGGPEAMYKKNMVGVDIETGIELDFGKLDLSNSPRGGALNFAGGMIRPLNDGGFAWTTSIESFNATAIRLHFTDFNLPSNVGMFIYNDEGQAFGPFAGQGPNRDGEFWANTIFGPVAHIQLRSEGPVSKADLTQLRLTIGSVGHMTEDFIIPGFYRGTHTGTNKAFCSFNASCVVDASCYTSVSAVDDARDGVAHILFASGGGYYICSGGLLNDTDTSTTIPYFLTANHCISTSSEASSMEAYWQFATSSCGGACVSRTTAPSTTGATILSTSSTSDYTFMQLSQTPPSGSVLMGWNSTAVAFSNGTPLYRISHPAGAPQAYSQHNVSTSKGTCGSWPRGNWIYEADITGATEGGSSGSPVVNASGQVVGQLSGACGTNPSNPCASSSNATVDGAFAAYYSNIDQWLDPSTGGGGGSTMHVASILPQIETLWIWRRAYITVNVDDDNNDNVSNATVAINITGTWNGSGSGATDASGNVIFTTGWTTGSVSYTTCVTNITHASLTYDSNDNVETCDTY